MRLRHIVLLPVLSGLPLMLGGCSGDDNNGPAPDGGSDGGSESGVEGGTGRLDGGAHDSGLDVTTDTSTSTDGAPNPEAEGGGGPSDAGGTTDAADAAAADAADAADAARTDAADAARADADGAADVATGQERTFLRFAALSPDAPAVDFCIQARVPSGGESPPFSGPLGRANGLASGLSYPQVSGYLGLPPDAYDVRVVGAGATDCLNALPGSNRYGSLPRLNPGEYTTIVFSGLVNTDGGPGLDMQGFRDDHVPVADGAALRAIHAVPGVAAVDVGLSTGESFSAFTTYLSYLGFSRGADFDFNGYLLTAPISGQTLAIRGSSSGATLLTIPGFALPALSVRTAFAIGVPGSTSTPLQILICDDLSAGPTTTCTRVPQ